MAEGSCGRIGTHKEPLSSASAALSARAHIVQLGRLDAWAGCPATPAQNEGGSGAPAPGLAVTIRDILISPGG